MREGSDGDDDGVVVYLRRNHQRRQQWTRTKKTNSRQPRENHPTESCSGRYLRH